MSGKKRRKASNSFRQAVQNTHELGEDAYCSGLRALTDSDSRRIVSGKVPIWGSVNLDAALRLHYPNDARWDYGIGIQKGKPWTLWVEVHPADTSKCGRSAEETDLAERLACPLSAAVAQSYSATIGVPLAGNGWGSYQPQ
jgi:hypothetical protein